MALCVPFAVASKRMRARWACCAALGLTRRASRSSSSSRSIPVTAAPMRTRSAARSAAMPAAPPAATCAAGVICRQASTASHTCAAPRSDQEGDPQPLITC